MIIKKIKSHENLENSLQCDSCVCGYPKCSTEAEHVDTVVNVYKNQTSNDQKDVSKDCSGA